MNRAELENKVKALELELSQAKEQLAAIPKKWRPLGGKFYVDEEGSVSEKVSHLLGNQDFGNEYRKREQAEKAAKAMRAHNRLLAYVAEFAPDWEPNWLDEFQLKAEVVFDVSRREWHVECSVNCCNPSSVYMPEYAAEELSAKLNSGEVEL